ncbi:MAG: glycosyltransferase family 39 protein [Candidatus Woesebacteria bacterium]
MAIKKIPSIIWLTVLYFATHLPALILLPVFADEAIYIRWSQLIIDDAGRFAFFSMADGKPPLFMWLLSFTLRPFADPLWAARFTSVCIGLLTVFAVGALAKIITGNKKVVIVSQLITVFAPFWWFYHRMALMDGLLTLLLVMSMYCAIHIAIQCQKEKGIAYDTIPWILLLGVFFGGALITKTPALFAIPAIALTPVFAIVKNPKYTKRKSRQKLTESIILITLGGIVGCVIFLLLRISPFFGALFTRSGDFTFTIKELLSGEWRYVLFSSLPREIDWVGTYLTIAVLLSSVLGLLRRRTRNSTLFLLACSIFFALPLIALGRVLYPRYFLPIAPFLTIAAAIGLVSIPKARFGKLLTAVLVIAFCIQTLFFNVVAVTNVASIPFVAIDRMQYLEEWSAGFGNAEVRDYLRVRYIDHPHMIVMTEGAFGTLPDGLLMYFFGPNQLDGMEIKGIGVGPSVLPPEYLEQSPTKEVYYVVNSHRFKVAYPSILEKILEVKRPNGAPSLLLYKVK